MGAGAGQRPVDGGLIDQYTNILYEACLANSEKWDDKNNGWNVYAYDSSGDVVARNYALVTQGPSDATTIILR